MTWCLHVLGTSSATPTALRSASAQLLATDETSFLIDCGEGTQTQLLRFGIKRSRIDHIFLSHLHGDHIFGLPGLLMSFNLDNRSKALHIYGPKGTEHFVKSLSDILELRFSYPIKLWEHKDKEATEIFHSKTMVVITIPLHHRIRTTGYLFKEVRPPRKMIGDLVDKYDIPYESIPGIKAGEGFSLPGGEFLSNEELTIAGRKPYTYAYCSDTAFQPSISGQVAGIDLLYHEATFLNEHAKEAEEKMHSTAEQAATIAKIAKVERLLLGHFSARYDQLDQFKQEAAVIFSATEIAKEGQQWFFRELREQHI